MPVFLEICANLERLVDDPKGLWVELADEFPDFGAPSLCLAKAHERDGDTRAALLEAAEACERPLAMGSYQQLAQLLMRQGAEPQALKALCHAAAWDPNPESIAALCDLAHTACKDAREWRNTASPWTFGPGSLPVFLVEVVAESFIQEE